MKLIRNKYKIGQFHFCFSYIFVSASYFLGSISFFPHIFAAWGQFLLFSCQFPIAGFVQVCRHLETFPWMLKMFQCESIFPQDEYVPRREKVHKTGIYSQMRIYSPNWEIFPQWGKFSDIYPTKSEIDTKKEEIDPKPKKYGGKTILTPKKYEMDP